MLAIQFIATNVLFALALAGFVSQSALAEGLQASAGGAAACAQVQAITQAERTVAVDGQEPVVSSAALPDTLSVDLLSDRAHLRYTLRFAACPGDARALWIFRAGAPYVVLGADGQPLQTLVGLPSGAAQFNGRVPQLFALPPGAQTVQVVFQTKPHLFLGLFDVAVGPLPALAEREAQAVGAVVGYGPVGAGVLVLAGLLGLFLWAQRRSEASLLWLALACLLWGARGIIYFDNVLPLPARWFELLNPLLVLGTSVCVALTCIHWLPAPAPKARRVFAVLVAAALVLFVVAGLGGPGMALSIAACLLVGYLILLWLLGWLWLRRRALQTQVWAALTLAMLAMLAVGAHDTLMLYRLVPSTHPYLLFWGFTVLLLVCVALSASYMMRNLRQAELFNAQLEQTIAAKTAQLQASFALLGESEREGARTQERESLLREMHDGIGAQLITALRGMERGALSPGQVQAALQDSLDDLRMLMDSTDVGRHLHGALAAWRNRWDPRLAALGLVLHWSVDEALQSVALPPDAVLQLMRILQEATANVVKHAGAGHAALTVLQSEGHLVLRLDDDGCGLPDAPHQSGRGLRNMQHRAQMLGGVLSVMRREAPERGTGVLLRLPLSP